MSGHSSFLRRRKLESNIKGPQDLAGKVIGADRGSTSEEYLTGANLAISGRYRNSAEMFADLDRGVLEAVVHDLPALHYHAGTEGKGKVKIVGKMFDKQDYGFLLPEDSPLKEPIDWALLRLMENGTIGAIHDKWFAAAEEQR
jgi:polar amino acid transport system substrate-binding protein